MTGNRDVEESKQVPANQFATAAIFYSLSAPLLYFAYLAELIQPRAALYSVAIALVINLGLWIAFKTRWNERREDPSLTNIQINLAIGFLMIVSYFFDKGRSLVLIWCFVVLIFGVFHFNTREFIFTALTILAGYGAVINLLMHIRPDAIEVYLEWFHWLTLALVLPAFALIGGRISALRSRLAENNAELMSAMGTIQELATHDSLTGLANRASLHDHLQQAISRAERAQSGLALFIIDMDQFKEINDMLGHPNGDSVLREVARRLSALIREGDTLARIGGDEFAIVMENFNTARDIAPIAEKLLASLSQPIQLQGQSVPLSASIGISTYPDQGKTVTVLVSNADLALYQAKEKGRKQFCAFSSGLGSKASEKFNLEAALRRAIDDRQLVVHYQPKVNLATGRIGGVEALLRWEHPELGLIFPDRFIPLAEETGLIIPIGLWVMREVCERAVTWEKQGLPPLVTAVNLTASQLLHASIVDDCAAILKSTGRKANLLELEITESMVMHNLQLAIESLNRLRTLGVQLAIDDFGTGYSSLAYLKKLPVDTLKIDRSFVRELPDNPDDVAIMRAIVAMGHSLNLHLVAEGVERENQRNMLKDEGCHEYQGFLCSRALPESELLPFITAHHDRLAQQIKTA